MIKSDTNKKNDFKFGIYIRYISLCIMVYIMIPVDF